MLLSRPLSNCVCGLPTASDLWSEFLPRIGIDLGYSLSDTDQEGHRFSADIVEHEDRFEITADVPGVSKSDVNVECENDLIRISANRREEALSEGANYRRKERVQGLFSRSFRLPHVIETEDVSAMLTDGVLKVTVNKPKADVKRIEIR